MTPHVQYRSPLSLPPDIDIAIWGTGSQGLNVFEVLSQERPDIRVSYFIDSFREGVLLGRPIIKPNQIDAMPSVDMVLVASHFQSEIISSMPQPLLQKTSVAHSRFTRSLRFAKGKANFTETILVELTQFCVMACEFCTHRIRPNSTIMPFDQFESIIDQIATDHLANAVELSGLGEPLLYRHIFDAVKLSKSKGLAPCFLTNGVLLTPEVLTRLNANGMYRLFVSLQTISPESYQHRGIKIDKTFQEYMNQICAVIETHVAEKFETKLFFKLLYAKPEWTISQIWNLPGIVNDTVHAVSVFEPFHKQLSNISRRQNIPLMISINDFADALNCLDETGYNSIELQIFPGIEIHLTNLHPVFHTDMMALNRERLTQFRYVLPERMDCTLIELPYITATCDVFPCPSNLFDPKDAEELCLGNVKTTRLRDILTGDKYRTLSCKALTGTLDFNVCRKCKTRYQKVNHA
ncbi:MAG: radical SAM protein [Desulfamplus sp.]|nr:radical SAM protein [Desulfamplus sp.]